MMGFPKPVSVSGASYSKFGNRKDYVYLNMWGKPVPGGTFDVDDFATAFVRFENGSTLTLECCWAANIPRVNWSSHLMGDKGGAKYDLDDNLEIYTEEAGYIADIKPYYNEVDMYQAQMEHYVEVLRGTVEPVCLAEHGVTVQKIIDGIYESAAKGKEVEL